MSATRDASSETIGDSPTSSIRCARPRCTASSPVNGAGSSRPRANAVRPARPSAQSKPADGSPGVGINSTPFRRYTRSAQSATSSAGPKIVDLTSATVTARDRVQGSSSFHPRGLFSPDFSERSAKSASNTPGWVVCLHQVLSCAAAFSPERHCTVFTRPVYPPTAPSTLLVAISAHGWRSHRAVAYKAQPNADLQIQPRTKKS